MTLGPRRARSILSTARLAALVVASSVIAVAAAHAVEVGLPPSDAVLPPLPDSKIAKDRFKNPNLQPGAVKRDPNGRMLMEAKELVYDYDREIVTAVGAVDIYYDGRALQADRVAYDQKSNRVRAMGRVKLTERNGNVVYSESLDVTDTFRDGFIESVRVETVDSTYLAAARGRRENGQLTVFDRAVYTACEPCRDNPQKPPLWQIKAKRVIWREDEKTIYYENATFELFGKPIAWLPFFSTPDPSVTRKSGILAPRVSKSGDVGYAVEIPYYYVLSPTADVTLAPVFTSHQGVMLKGEYREQLIDGAYMIRAAGISQRNPDRFDSRVPVLDDLGNPNRDGGLKIGPGEKKERWAFSTKGQFDINEKWKWGWDINAVSDKWVRGDYNLWGSRRDATSTLYLTGQGDRSFFEIRGYHFYGMTRYDQQDRLPWVAPVVDYNYVFEDPVAGGELAFNINATSTYRREADYANFRTRALVRPDNALIGAEGTYSRISGDVQWRRQFIDPVGQVFTPFAFVRGDLIYTDLKDNARMGPFLDGDQDAMFRGMAGVGLEYRYPFIAETAYGAHQIEPIAQIILRPNENKIGKLPNEDAQSLLYDDTVLFAWDKFSGYDRIEGGSRANVGGQYTFTTLSGGTFSVLGGQSFHLFGRNSFDELDATRTGDSTGLESRASDYVGGVSLAPNEFFSFGGHLRLDEDSFKLRSAEVSGRMAFDRVQANLIYGRYDEQPLQGYDRIREGVLAGSRLFLTDEFYVEGGARYNFDYEAFDRTELGLGVLDLMQCLSLGFTYVREVDNDNESTRVSQVDHRFLFKFDFRTLGGAGYASRKSARINEEDSVFNTN